LEQRASLGEKPFHPLVALLAEGTVADGEHLVDEEDGLVELRDDGEA